MERGKPKELLRKGWTTGACATAAATAAFKALHLGRFEPQVEIVLPKGERPVFVLHRSDLGNNAAEASVIKDAGDDPDVTHGAEIIARVQKADGEDSFVFLAGEGVGTVTLPGLPLAVGEPAINPAPRRMMETNIASVARDLGVAAAAEITLSITGGEELAAKTMNPRLGIKGGLSVLGTTGIVIPYSCSSWIHSIHRGIDVARAASLSHIAAATGSTSEKAVAAHYDLVDQAMIDMGDFAGGLLKYLRSHPVERLTIAGGFAKLSKLAQGHLDLHSSRSSLDFGELALRVSRYGGDAALCEQVRSANTGLEVLNLCLAAGVPIGNLMATGAREVAMATLSGGTQVEVLIFDRQGQLVGTAGGLSDG